MKDKDYLKELQLKTVQELETELQEKRRNIFSDRIDHSQGKLGNHQKISRSKRQVAEILTIIQEKKSA